MLFVSIRSLSRSVDENQIESGDFASSIEDDILGDIRSKIEAKIKNYEDMIEVDMSAVMLKTCKKNSGSTEAEDAVPVTN